MQRIYGEHGAQMVKLLRENPAYAIPIVFKRLQQKDCEWCAFEFFRESCIMQASLVDHLPCRTMSGCNVGFQGPMPMLAP